MKEVAGLTHALFLFVGCHTPLSRRGSIPLTKASIAALRQNASRGPAFSHSEAESGSVSVHFFISVSAVPTAAAGLTCAKIQSAFGPAASSKSRPAASWSIISYKALPGSAIFPISRCTPANPSQASTALEKAIN